ncbi:TetR/AcrR family transcriptional regulator [Streptomyces decoyicus]|uniref:TetR/AcrR family transcriptional regulator n=1 Tax=Streptomyces decoyicus TaxID=249567 RepID=UPI0004AB4421|nr:TetR/AcrR family transcriptional regulator [Streptomyces decoyicus]KOG38335.1 TetR family transcriptional regulator [Streptomyces decoyicus]QZY20689.1 TetR/AcrR family transcriptional regulator [Streptomyces decoyicus]
MIVAVALPLVAEYGAAVTTSQIARAAGIGEATIFRAFKDKDELLDACVAEAVGTDHVLRELASISLDEPLAVRLTEAAEALRAHLERLGTVVGALHASGHRRGREPGAGPRDGDGPPRDGDGPRREGDGPPRDGRAESVTVLRNAVVELIEPDRAAFRLSPEKVASAFLGLLFTRLQTPVAEADAPLTPDELIDVLLHGALHHPGST